MDTLDAALVLEQNKIASSGAWIWLINIVTSPTTQYRLANNNYEVEWNSGTYLPASFTIDDVSFSTSGKFPEFQLRLGNVAISGLRQSLRTSSGLVGQTIQIRVVHSAHLDLDTPAIDETAEILSTEVTAEAVVFTLGIPSLLSRRFPRDRYVPGFCRHRFAGALCQYVQLPYRRISSQISFVAGPAGSNYNTILCGNGSLITHVFFHAPGTPFINPDRRALTKDTGFTVAGSQSNDGFFLANNDYFVRQTYVQAVTEANGGRPFVAEAAGNSITIQLGYNACNHTLEACALRDNTHHYGGSPGVIGGMYG